MHFQTSLWIQFGHHLFSALILGAIFYGVGNDGSRPFDNFKFCISVLIFFMYTYTMAPVLLRKYSITVRNVELIVTVNRTACGCRYRCFKENHCKVGPRIWRSNGFQLTAFSSRWDQSIGKRVLQSVVQPQSVLYDDVVLNITTNGEGIILFVYERLKDTMPNAPYFPSRTRNICTYLNKLCQTEVKTFVHMMVVDAN